jgi:hypothetical protein
VPLDHLLALCVDEVFDFIGFGTLVPSHYVFREWKLTVVGNLGVQSIFSTELVHNLFGTGIHIGFKLGLVDVRLDLVLAAVLDPGDLSSFCDAGQYLSKLRLALVLTGQTALLVCDDLLEPLFGGRESAVKGLLHAVVY